MPERGLHNGGMEETLSQCWWTRASAQLPWIGTPIDQVLQKGPFCVLFPFCSKTQVMPSAARKEPFSVILKASRCAGPLPGSPLPCSTLFRHKILANALHITHTPMSAPDTIFNTSNRIWLKYYFLTENGYICHAAYRSNNNSYSSQKYYTQANHYPIAFYLFIIFLYCMNGNVPTTLTGKQHTNEHRWTA